MFDLLNKIFGGWKTWGITVFITSLVAGLWDFVVDLILQILNYGLSLVSSIATPDSVVVNMTGVAGYFAIHLKFAECLAVIFFAITTKFVLRKIPFLNW